MTDKPSGRIIVDADGKERHVPLDTKEGADVSAGHGYDAGPGALYNAIRALGPEQSAIVFLQSQAERERIMGLEGKAREDAIAALKAGDKKPAPPTATADPKGSKS
jgi:hypothetical protein